MTHRHSFHASYLHLLPIEPGEMLTSWLLRITDRYGASFRNTSKFFLGDKTRSVAGYDAYPTLILLRSLNAINPMQEGSMVG
jgi:hypothetical protein